MSKVWSLIKSKIPESIPQLWEMYSNIKSTVFAPFLKKEPKSIINKMFIKTYGIVIIKIYSRKSLYFEERNNLMDIQAEVDCHQTLSKILTA